MKDKLIEKASRFLKRDDESNLRTSEMLPSPIFKKGFHGDVYLLEVVDMLIPHVATFIETGTYNGVTVAYTAHTYPKIRCLSCEPDRTLFRFARENTKHLRNVRLYNETSQVFIRQLNRRGVKKDHVLFWLDAHGAGFEWPLKEEISFITGNFDSAFILIDDFKVPGLDCFGYDVWGGQECSFEYIHSSLNSSKTYRLYYPTYTEHTSDYHPLRGWALIEFGRSKDWELPGQLVERVRQAPLQLG